MTSLIISLFCTQETPRPPNRVDTLARVKALQATMKNISLTGGDVLDAYIIRTGDEHMVRIVVILSFKMYSNVGFKRLL